MRLQRTGTAVTGTPGSPTQGRAVVSTRTLEAAVAMAACPTTEARSATQDHPAMVVRSAMRDRPATVDHPATVVRSAMRDHRAMVRHQATVLAALRTEACPRTAATEIAADDRGALRGAAARRMCHQLSFAADSKILRVSNTPGDTPCAGWTFVVLGGHPPGCAPAEMTHPGFWRGAPNSANCLRCSRDRHEVKQTV
jgi:hypothetical protein